MFFMLVDPVVGDTGWTKPRPENKIRMNTSPNQQAHPNEVRVKDEFPGSYRGI